MLNTCDKMVEYLKFLPQKKDVEASEVSLVVDDEKFSANSERLIHAILSLNYAVFDFIHNRKYDEMRLQSGCKLFLTKRRVNFQESP